MELNIEEIDDSNREDYWIKDERLSKKRVSFNDILSNMNLVVDKNGVLKFMSYKTAVEKEEQKQPIDKNSYIYNKYFKDYDDANIKPEPRRPKTIEEYNAMLLEDKQKQIERIIKERKNRQLLLTSGPSHDGQSVNKVNNIRASNTNLRFMNFHC